jgi:hypothetical protein
MDSFARNALRLSLAGAGVAVLGAGFVGQASAAEAQPGVDTLNNPAPDTSNVESQLTGAVPSSSDNNLSVAGQDLGDAAAPTAVPTASTPSTDALPSLADTHAFQVPSVANLQAPGLS